MLEITFRCFVKLISVGSRNSVISLALIGSLSKVFYFTNNHRLYLLLYNLIF